MTFGFNKRFSTAGSFFASHSRRGTIRGRLFVDRNLNGVFNVGEPGISGIRVELEEGHSVVTDAEGRFEFSGMRSETYHVRVPLDQFNEAVRLTGPADVVIPVSGGRDSEVNFGVVNFARLVGNVYNNYAMDGKKQPDANGVPHVRLFLEGNGVRRELLSDGAGDYGVFDIMPGDYQLTLDPTTLPANFVGPDGPIAIHVAPVTTIAMDIPVRAIRSISGVVSFKQAPIAGVQITAGAVTASTAADGTFMLRDLPAGELTLNVVAKNPLPAGLNAPTGKIKLPREPIAVENVSIVISNPDLLPFLK
jgi:hypothetical protein